MLSRAAALPGRLARIRRDIRAGLPEELWPALRFIALPIPTRIVRSISREIEQVRFGLAGRKGDGVEVWYSPEPGSWSKDSGVGPIPGKPLKLSWPQVASTGKNRYGGILLHLLARGFSSQRCLELGSCAGLSARYLATAPSVVEIVTIEGSPSLSAVASEVLAPFSSARVINATFTEAIDRLRDTADRGFFDFVFIDGHHECRATLHYFERLRPLISPGAVVVFDDVSWSDDMRVAWQAITADPAFAHSFALGNIGVCLMKTDADSPISPPRVWDMEYLIPLAPVGKPWGWERGTEAC